MKQKELIHKMLDETKVMAVVGLSPKEHRTSHTVSKNMQEKGYKIIPVYPREETIMGEKVYRSVSEIPQDLDMVVIFRRSEDVMPVVEDAVKKKPRFIWMQQGIVNEKAAKLAREHGAEVIMDSCVSLQYVYYNNEKGE